MSAGVNEAAAHYGQPDVPEEKRDDLDRAACKYADARFDRKSGEWLTAWNAYYQGAYEGLSVGRREALTRSPAPSVEGAEGRALLKEARDEIHACLEAEGGCDHSVGICSCGTRQLLARIDAALLSPREGGGLTKEQVAFYEAAMAYCATPYKKWDRTQNERLDAMRTAYRVIASERAGEGK